MGTAREQYPREVNELDELEGLESDQFVEVTRNDETAQGCNSEGETYDTDCLLAGVRAITFVVELFVFAGYFKK